MSTFKGAFGDDVVFDIYQGTTYECLKGLEDGKYDVVFCGRLDGVSDDIELIPQFSQNVVLAVNSSHPLAQRDVISLRELSDTKLTSHRSQSYMHIIFEGLFKAYNLNVEQGFDDEISAASLVASDSKYCRNNFGNFRRLIFGKFRYSPYC